MDVRVLLWSLFLCSCVCVCGYANGYVNRMLQHVRHKFCWKSVGVRATNRPTAVTFQLAPIKLSLKPFPSILPFLATLQLEDHGMDREADAISLTHPPTQWRHWLPAAQINYESSVLFWSSQMANFPLQLSLWEHRVGGVEKAKSAIGGGIFPLYLRRTVTAKNSLQAPNTRKETRRDR